MHIFGAKTVLLGPFPSLASVANIFQRYTHFYGLNVCVTSKIHLWNPNAQCNSVRKVGPWGRD